ncbi:MAG: hypothetical protein ABIJ57_09475 [Pseudomonadota bacterium]|uniref:Uncharacterized protein n=1 Tax=viral metagenome TaxID=1070528 RepID=A0A6M3J8P8_9ZZZZ
MSEKLLIEQATAVNLYVLGDQGGFETRAAQTFTLAKASTVMSVSVGFNATTGAPAGNVTYRIETVTAGVPTGTLVHASATKAFSPTQSSWNKQAFASSFQLAGGVYALVLSCANQANDQYWTISGGTSSPYAGGTAYHNVDAGSWIDQGWDIAFRIYGDVTFKAGIIMF